VAKFLNINKPYMNFLKILKLVIVLRGNRVPSLISDGSATVRPGFVTERIIKIKFFRN
jgi:hypothetical protein